MDFVGADMILVSNTVVLYFLEESKGEKGKSLCNWDQLEISRFGCLKDSPFVTCFGRMNSTVTTYAPYDTRHFLPEGGVAVLTRDSLTLLIIDIIKVVQAIEEVEATEDDQ